MGEAASCSVVVQTSNNGMVYEGIVPTLQKELKEDLHSVSRKSDPVMSIELGLEGGG